MWTRWIIRLVVIMSVLVIGAMADAQNRNADGGSSAGGGGNRGGGAAAPSRGSSSSNAGGGGSSNSGTGGSVSGTGSAVGSTGSSIGSTGAPIRGTGTNAAGTSQGEPARGANPQPPVKKPPILGNPPKAPILGNPKPPITGIGTDPDRQRREREANRDRNRPPKYPGATYILPPRYGWAPYTWWFNGNSYWMPSGWDDGYYGEGYRDDTYDGSRYDRVADAPPPPPAQDQARATNALEGIPAYSQAMVEFKAAQQAYEDASERVLARLRKDPEYQRLVARRDRAAEEVEARQASSRIPPNESDRVLSAAQEKLNASSKVTKMEQDAIAADPQASAAKGRMVEANERLAALRKQVEGAGGVAPK